MKSAEFEMFPGHITLPPKPGSFFGDKKSVRQSFLTLWGMQVAFLNRARNLLQNEKTTVSPQSLI